MVTMVALTSGQSRTSRAIRSAAMLVAARLVPSGRAHADLELGLVVLGEEALGDLLHQRAQRATRPTGRHHHHPAVVDGEASTFM
jgi:hypothetical protein